MVSKAIWVGGSEEQKKEKSQCDNGNEIDWKTVTKSSYHLNNSLKYIETVHRIIPSTEGGGDVKWGNGDVCSIKDGYCGFSKFFTDYSHFPILQLSQICQF